jgi:hypothetical protein
VTQIVTNGVDEPPPIKVQQVTIDGKPVQVVHVPASPAASRPHLVDGVSSFGPALPIAARALARSPRSPRRLKLPRSRPGDEPTARRP